MRTRTNENIVSSFMFYMWNAWSEEEAIKVFGERMGRHFFGKGRLESIYADMTTDNRIKLVERACELYDGNCRRKENK